MKCFNWNIPLPSLRDLICLFKMLKISTRIFSLYYFTSQQIEKINVSISLVLVCVTFIVRSVSLCKIVKKYTKIFSVNKTHFHFRKYLAYAHMVGIHNILLSLRNTGCQQGNIIDLLCVTLTILNVNILWAHFTNNIFFNICIYTFYKKYTLFCWTVLFLYTYKIFSNINKRVAIA